MTVAEALSVGLDVLDVVGAVSLAGHWIASRIKEPRRRSAEAVGPPMSRNIREENIRRPPWVWSHGGTGRAGGLTGEFP